MDSKGRFYYIGIAIVAATTFFFVMYVLPYLPPIVGIFIIIVMLGLISLAYGLRFWRWKTAPKESQVHEQNQVNMITQDYIEQAERLMGKK